MSPVLLLGATLALRATDALTLDLAGDVEVSGTFVRAEPGLVVLRSAGGPVEVPVSVIEGVSLNGAPWTVGELRAELDEAALARAALLADPPAAPAPAVVVGASLLWSGVGHALLGESRAALGYAATDAVLIGTGALSLTIPRNRGAAVTIFALDLALRGYAAAEAAHLARNRRELRPPD